MKRRAVRRSDVAEGGELPSTVQAPCRPFLKWVGGKGQLLPELLAAAPRTFESYFEPFIGGGALFFALRPEQGALSDINEDLINAYQVVRDDPEGLIRKLQGHRYEKGHYYEVREADRTPTFARWSKARRAARLIYLNRTCYNGLYRVNSRGYFNAPFGKYVNPRIVDAENHPLFSRGGGRADGLPFFEPAIRHVHSAQTVAV